MDHIPLPRGPLVEPAVIPLYLHQRYDGGTFDTYLKRIEWSSVDLPPVFYNKESQVTDRAEIAALLQRWLYFGLLEAVTEQETDPASFGILADSSDLKFSSLPLEDIISR